MDPINDEEETLKGKADFGIDFSYTVDNLKEFMDEDHETPLVENELFDFIFETSLSTARGIIFQSTEDIILGGILLPIISVEDLTGSD
jgi:hypothetical protein